MKNETSAAKFRLECIQGPWMIATDDNDIFVEVIDSLSEQINIATFPADDAGYALARQMVADHNNAAELRAALEAKRAEKSASAELEELRGQVLDLQSALIALNTAACGELLWSCDRRELLQNYPCLKAASDGADKALNKLVEAWKKRAAKQSA